MERILTKMTGMPDKLEYVASRAGMERLKEMRREGGRMSVEEYERSKWNCASG